MKLISLSFSLLIYNSLYCQITIVNNYNVPISSVKLYSSKQTFLAQSNNSGVVQWNKLQNQKLNDTIYFNHISYNSKWIIRNNIKRNDTIVLTDKYYQLPAALVTANKISKKYQTINACYRSYQTNNDSLIYYTDGLVEYLTKTNKNKYQKRLKEYRTYEDSIYVSDIKKRNFMVIFRVARIPPPLVEYLPKKYFKRKDLHLSKDTNGNIDILTKNNMKIGIIEKDSNFVTYLIDDIFSNKSRKLPKYEAIQLKSEVTLVFKLSENNYDFLINSFDELVYSKIYRKYNFKYVTDTKFIEIENVEEIFVEDVKYLNKIETEKYSKGFGFPKQSNYSTQFWKKCKCKLYYPPPYSPFLLTR